MEIGYWIVATILAAFNLFAGVDGSNQFQRRLRRLAGRRLGAQRASTVLRAAAAELPPEALDARVDSAVGVAELRVFQLAAKRSGPMQRFIH